MTVNLRKAVPDDLAWLEALIRAFPFKDAQRRFYGVQRSCLDTYNIQRTQAFLSVADHGGFVGVGAEGDPVGYFALGRSSWHSDIFGLNYFRIENLWSVTEQAKEPLLEAAMDFARGQGAEIVDLRADGDDFALAQAAESLGGRFLGMSIKYGLKAKDLDNARDNSYGSWSKEKALLRPAEPGDLEWMMALAREAHQISHFFNDPLLPLERVREVFPAWVQRCFKGLADSVMVLTVGGAPAGLVTLLLPKKLSEALGVRFGVLDFIAIAPSFQGRGLGTGFARQAFAWLAERAEVLEVRTMANNLSAQNLYTRLGFRAIATDVHFHIGSGGRK